MNGRQQSFINMCTVTKTTVDKFDPLVLAAIPNFSTSYIGFKQSNARISKLADLQQIDRSGNTVNKRSKRAELTAFALDLVAKTVSYAGSVQDYVLLNTINFNKSKFAQQSSLEFSSSCSILSKKLREKLPFLAVYQITAAVMDDFDALRGSNDVVSPLPISGRNVKKVATTDLIPEIKIAKGHLPLALIALVSVRVIDRRHFRKVIQLLPSLTASSLL